MNKQLQILQNPKDIESQRAASVDIAPTFNGNPWWRGTTVTSYIPKSPFEELPMDFAGRNELEGHEFTQISSTTNAYMFKVMHKGETRYEVFMKKINYDLLKNEYPTLEAFGQSAWKFQKELDAFDQFFKISGID